MFYDQKIYKIGRLLGYMFRYPKIMRRCVSQIPENIRGIHYSNLYQESKPGQNDLTREEACLESANALEDFFNNRMVGRGIWKWQHYFDIYHTYFKKFIGKNVNVLEIGVFSGGSLEMWRHYFGEGCHIYGVDIAEVCKEYDDGHTTVFIGDQEDRSFWRKFKTKVPQVDILIDDGGHTVGQQIVTLEEMLPHIRPGGIYVCEDVHGVDNGFNSYCQGLIKSLNEMTLFDPNSGPKGGMRPNPLQAWIEGVHFYPYVTVIVKSERPIEKLMSLEHGTIWQPINTTLQAR